MALVDVLDLRKAAAEAVERAVEQYSQSTAVSNFAASNQECEGRLPCGLCRYTMSECPKTNTGFTWATSTADGAGVKG